MKIIIKILGRARVTSMVVVSLLSSATFIDLLYWLIGDVTSARAFVANHQSSKKLSNLKTVASLSLSNSQMELLEQFILRLIVIR